MISALLDRYEKELKYKISLKMIPNKTEEQILYQNFKFFDLEGAGFCNLKDFIRTNEKIGVVLSHMQDFQDIFNYFDTEHIGVINYRQFCKDIFTPRSMSQQQNLPHSVSGTNNNRYQKQQIPQTTGTPVNSVASQQQSKNLGPFFDKFVNNLLQNGAAIALISLCKEFKLLDFNSSNRLTIDDFIKVISENKINLSISDIQLLFHCYDLNNNGQFYYEEMFRDLKNLFWNAARTQFIGDMYSNLTKNKKGIMVNDLKNMFDPKNHPYINEIGAQRLYDEYNAIVDCYLCIKRMSRGNFQLTRSDLEEFFKFYSFGIESNDEFMDIVGNCFYFPEGNSNEQNTPLRRVNSGVMPQQQKPKTPNYASFAPPQQQQQLQQGNNNQFGSIEPIIMKMKNSLQKFGVKTFFGLLKHFKYYDNGTKMITKYDFAKVLKDFRLNLTINEIEKIFDNFCTDNRRLQLNYEDFIYSLTSYSIPEERIRAVENVFDKLSDYSRRIGEKITIDLIKSMYWAKQNYFGLDENQAFGEFCDNIEMFHYAIRSNKSPLMNKDEFIDFYKIISFIIDEDADFIDMLYTEWKKVMTNNNDEYPTQKTPNRKENIQQQYQQQYQQPYQQQQQQIQELQQNLMQRPKTPIQQQQQPLPQKLRTNNAGSRSTTPLRNQNQYTSSYQQPPQDPLHKIEHKLRLRGVRGLMNLHKQFLFTCNNLASITFNDFVHVLKLQRIEMSQTEIENIFNRYSQEENGSFLNFPLFIRAFKKELKDTRLDVVEKAFSYLDRDQTETLFLDDIKLKFNGRNHPEVKLGRKNEDEIITEFLDCFELNYNLLTTADNPETSNVVTFEEFANFYEYVSFLYTNDNEFVSVVSNSWNLR